MERNKGLETRDWSELHSNEDLDIDIAKRKDTKRIMKERLSILLLVCVDISSFQSIYVFITIQFTVGMQPAVAGCIRMQKETRLLQCDRSFSS